MKLYTIPLFSILLKNTILAFSDTFIYEDALSKPHFQIYFTDQVLNNDEISVLERETKNEVIKMISKENNEHYICEIPKVKKEKEKIVRRSNVSNVKTALALLEPMKNKCLYHTSGWWSYEFCYGKSIRQYHIAGKKEPARFNSNYILGKYTKYLELSSGKTEETKELVRITPNGKNYFTQKFIDGTKCDKTNIPRTAEIQYYCGIDESIIYVKETSTCNYEVAISTNRLCKDPVFNPQINSSVNSIVCYLYKTVDEENNSLTSEDYLFDYDEDQSDNEKLSELHKKYKKENMRKASDLFKSKWMKSVNYKPKKVLVNPFYTTKEEQANKLFSEAKSPDFKNFDFKFVNFFNDPDQEGKRKEGRKAKDGKDRGKGEEKGSKEGTGPAVVKEIDAETIKLIMSKLEKLNWEEGMPSSERSVPNSNSNSNSNSDEAPSNPDPARISATKKIRLKEAVQAGKEGGFKRKEVDRATKQLLLQQSLKAQQEKEELGDQAEEDNDHDDRKRTL